MWTLPRIRSRFDPRPHARGDCHPRCPACRRPRFDPRPHARGDRSRRWQRGACSSFDPRPHARGDQQGRNSSTPPPRFDPRPHARGDGWTRCGGCSGWFRSTPPREGRLYGWRSLLRLGMVSIHAPTRGATSRRSSRYPRPRVSIHAPTRGATTIRSTFRAR